MLCLRIEKKSICKVRSGPSAGVKSFSDLTSTTGGDFVNSINSATNKVKLPWAKFPGEMHLPGMNFAGPGTNLDERLTSTDTYKEWSKPVDRVDNAAYHHDLAYKYLTNKAGKK